MIRWLKGMAIVHDVNNTRRIDPDTGLVAAFNLLDEMGPFDQSAFI